MLLPYRVEVRLVAVVVASPVGLELAVEQHNYCQHINMAHIASRPNAEIILVVTASV